MHRKPTPIIMPVEKSDSEIGGGGGGGGGGVFYAT